MKLADESFSPCVQPRLRSNGILAQNVGVPRRALSCRFPRSLRKFCPPSLGLAEVNLRLPVQASRRGKVVKRQGVVTLSCQRAVIDPYRHTGPLQGPVLVLGPTRAPFRQELVAIPLAGFDRPQTCRSGLPKRQENMGVMIMRMVAFFEHRRMNRHICDHAATDKRLMDEA